MSMHANLPGGRLPLLWCVALAVAADGPSPARSNHHRLQIIVAGEALGNRAAAPGVVLDLAAVPWTTSDEILKRLLGQRSGMPGTVIGGLTLLGRVDPEQPHE